MVALCLCLQNQVIVFFDGTGNRSAEGDFRTGQILSGRVINVGSRDCNGFSGFPLVHLRLQSIGKSFPAIIEILRNELFRAGILFDDFALPCQEIRYQFSLEFLIFRAEAAVNRAPDIGKIFPGIDAVAPVVQPELMIERIQIVPEKFFQIFPESGLRISAACIVRFCFIVQLKADDMLIGADFFHELSYDAFRVF